VAKIEYEAPVAQLVEHVLGKDEVSGSIPLVGSRFEGCPGCPDQGETTEIGKK
jgi:hypothetical protein